MAFAVSMADRNAMSSAVIFILVREYHDGLDVRQVERPERLELPQQGVQAIAPFARLVGGNGNPDQPGQLHDALDFRPLHLSSLHRPERSSRGRASLARKREC